MQLKIYFHKSVILLFLLRMPKIRNPDPYPEKRLIKSSGSQQLEDIIDSIVRKIESEENDMNDIKTINQIKATKNRDLTALEQHRLSELKESTKILQYYQCQLKYYQRYIFHFIIKDSCRRCRE